eukprot:Nk52_evm27s1178 gene=Nk52_evmTU27s1178
MGASYSWQDYYCNLYGKMTRSAYSKLEEDMNNAKDYGDWHAAASEYDRVEGNDDWKSLGDSTEYDNELIETRLRHLQKARELGDCDAMVFLLRSGLVRSLGGIGNPALYTKCFVGTKTLIEQYIDEVVLQLNMLCDKESPNFGLSKKETFFADTRQAFGRSALLLSGGASLGMYHFGVVKSLYEFNLLPRVISGGSIGALVVALLGAHSDEEIPRLFNAEFINFEAFEKVGCEGSARRKIARFLKHGVLMDVNVLEEFCRKNIGPYTFLEAYKKTGRIINITVASTQTYEMPKLLNYLTAPNVLLWSAAVASCAAPGVYKPVDLLAKDPEGEIRAWNPSKHKWSDGSLHNDLPMARLSELFNVNHFIVSQVNPHVAPFLDTRKKASRHYWFVDTVYGFMMSELQHRALQGVEIGLFPGIFKKLQPILTQKYQGDITIVPDIAFRDVLKYLSNPTKSTLIECMQAGERATWPYISIIRTHCKIELTLDACLKRVRKQLEESFGSPLDKERYLGPVFKRSDSNMKSFSGSSAKRLPCKSGTDGIALEDSARLQRKASVASSLGENESTLRKVAELQEESSDGNGDEGHKGCEFVIESNARRSM